MREDLVRVVSRHWKEGAAGLAAVVMVGSIVRFALADPPSVPRDADRAAAARELDATGELRVRRPEGDFIGGLGVIEPASPERTLAPAVPGRISVVHVTEGQFVTEGTVLVELEAEVERAALAAAEAEVAGAELDLQRIGGRVRTQDLAAIQRDAAAAEARAALSAATHVRLEATQDAGGLSPDERDRARRQAEQDRLAAEAATARLASARDARPLDERAALARLQAARARRDQAEAQIALRQIVAPTDGEILEILFEPGEYVQPGGEPVVRLGDTRTLRARIDIDERDLAALQPGAGVLVTVDAFPSRTFEGRVTRIGRRMGRKNLRTDEPTERVDVKILEVVVDLGEAPDLIVGQRVMAYLATAGSAEGTGS